jgi:hypothetical protein
MLRVCRSIAAVLGVFWVRMRSGCCATSSFANRCINSTSSAAQRRSIRVLRPYAQPTFWRPSRNAAIQACPSRSVSAYAISTPMRLIRSDCCARAASGHATAAPPSRVMNARRLIQSPCRLGRKGSAGTSRPSARSRDSLSLHLSGPLRTAYRPYFRAGVCLRGSIRIAPPSYHVPPIDRPAA